jgi:hypothetical protein
MLNLEKVRFPLPPSPLPRRSSLTRLRFQRQTKLRRCQTDTLEVFSPLLELSRNEFKARVLGEPEGGTGFRSVRISLAYATYLLLERYGERVVLDATRE